MWLNVYQGLKSRLDLKMKSAHCCGIVGYSGSDDACSILVDGIELLQNRGYDSCGLTTSDASGKLVTTKFASKGTTSDCVSMLKAAAGPRHSKHHHGIAHTRWATHGNKTDANAHPHHDWKNRVSVVHNGTIDNFSELKEELIEKGIPFKSQTDTEVIANLIGFYLDQLQKSGGDNKSKSDKSKIDKTKLDKNRLDKTRGGGRAGLGAGGGGSNVEPKLYSEAVRMAVERLRGTWGLLVMHQDDPQGFMLARNGSPMIVGGSEGRVYVASEPLAMARYTNEYIALNDGDVCYLDREGGIAHLEAGRHKASIHIDEIDTEPTPFAHWTIKEIYEQPQSLSRVLSFGARLPQKLHGSLLSRATAVSGSRLALSSAILGKSSPRTHDNHQHPALTAKTASSPASCVSGNNWVKLGGLEDRREELMKIRSLVITGCGTSLYAGHYGEKLFRLLSSFDDVSVVDSSEVDSQAFHTGANSKGILAISQSGETRDVVQALQLADEMNVRKFSVVNQVGSLVARMTGCGVYLHAGREVAVASTKAFTSQVAALAMIAIWFAQSRSANAGMVASGGPGAGGAGDEATRSPPRENNVVLPDAKIESLVQSLLNMPLICSRLLGLDSQCRAIAGAIKDQSHIFVLGKGFGYPVALEAALKIKEISYVHAEGYGGGQLKHGPFALLDEKVRTPVLALVLDDAHATSMQNAAQQVKARGAQLICITDRPELVKGTADHIIQIPSNGVLTALGAVVPCQLIAYHLATLRKINPDKPRGLAKTVTVM